MAAEPDYLVRVHLKVLPTNLGTVLDVLPKLSRVPQELYTDHEYLYGVALDEEVTLWRSRLLPDGTFGPLSAVLLPASDFPGRTIEDALDEAWRDGAWD